MIDLIRSTAAIVFVFGLVIFIHELGHFIAAKLMGVYAPRFSIGFGSALWSRKWGETEYMIAPFPLGGYVRMASRDDETMAFIEGGKEEPAPEGAAKPRHWDPESMAPVGPKPVPADHWFESKSFPARLFILSAGVTMNALLALVIFIGMAAGFGRPVLKTRVIGAVTPTAGIPQLALFAVGDTLLSVGGAPVTSWNRFDLLYDSLPADSLTIRTNRATVLMPASAPHSTERRNVLRALGPWIPPVVDQVTTGLPAQRAGMKAGDSIVAMDGTPAASWRAVVNYIEKSAGHTVTLVVARGAERASFSVRPDSMQQEDPATKQQVWVGKIGAVARMELGHEPVPFGLAVREGFEDTWRSAGLIVRSLQMLATGRASVRQLGGPVAIGSAAAQAAKQGWETLLNLLAIISINLAVVNLLPVPVLDGGQILILGAEKLKGGPLAIRTRETLMKVGLAFIAVLLIVVMFNDIPRLVMSFIKQ
jgi:regulator of sigma E protease